MNPKNALFLSASLTAFVLAVLFGVVTKVTNTSVAAAAAVAQASATTAILPSAVPTDVPTQDIQPAATQQGPLGPEEAAVLAAKAISRQDVYSVETFSYKGAESYKVVFSSGDIVYIGMDRTVLDQGKLPAVVASVNIPASAPTAKKHKGSSGSSTVQQPPASTPPPSGGGEGGGEGGDH